jgi:V8-like Glu-specific endopeptidase
VAFKPGMGLIIVQHPRGGPMKLAIDTKAVTEVTANQTRVRYRTNTEPGSSGSPCFTMGWELAALHHSGNPELQARYNEGVPLDTICDQLPTSARAAVGW